MARLLSVNVGLPRDIEWQGNTERGLLRISVKREPHGAAGAYIDTRVQAGDILEVSARAAALRLQQDERPVVFVSAGIGATPVLAMLHALAAEQTRREIWWIHGARNSSEHPFAAEVRELLKTLPGSRSHICYSAPMPTDRPSIDFDRVGNGGAVPESARSGVIRQPNSGARISRRSARHGHAMTSSLSQGLVFWFVDVPPNAWLDIGGTACAESTSPGQAGGGAAARFW